MKKRKSISETGSANRAAIASEEVCSIPFPPERRKLHIRSLLLPSQIVTVSLGHNLVLVDFAAPHAILMMAGSRHLADTVCRDGRPTKEEPPRTAKRLRGDFSIRSFSTSRRQGRRSLRRLRPSACHEYGRPRRSSSPFSPHSARGSVPRRPRRARRPRR